MSKDPCRFLFWTAYIVGTWKKENIGPIEIVTTAWVPLTTANKMYVLILKSRPFDVHALERHERLTCPLKGNIK